MIKNMMAEMKNSIVVMKDNVKETIQILENGLEDMGRGKGKLGRSERVAWTYVYYQM